MRLEIEVAEQQLRATRMRCSHITATSACGIYAWFLRDAHAFAPFPVPSDGLVYVGSSNNLAGRELEQHLSDTATSSLRRSLGAILKASLGAALPRTRNPSDKKRFTHYRFSPAAETWLTAWMHSNLDLAIVECDDHLGMESSLILRWRPLLCLTGWENPNRLKIRALRKACADEARAAA